ncbi:MAG: DUF983 domain-containing protein [Alphaproteobacteria bacterium]|nr:DUF983 domain-containing protein [Alphaproteobacteria bacterium]
MERSSLWKSALLCRCPSCGNGRLFEGFLKVRDECGVCRFVLKDYERGDGPAFFAMLAVSILAVLIAVGLEIWFEPPIWLHLLIETPVVLAGTVLGLRSAKAALIAIQYKHKVDGYGV